MKIIIFTWMLMLVTALAVNAQNLVGKQWQEIPFYVE